MRRLPSLVALAAALALPRPAAAQDPFGVLEGLFESVNSIAFYTHGAALQSDADLAGAVGGFALGGVGAELLLNLPSAGGAEFELGLGASALTGLEAVEPSLDLRASLRTLPTLAVYAAGIGVADGAPVEPYAGLTFGLAELWNARGYDADGTAYPLTAETFELGAVAGLYVDRVLPGLYVEVGYRHRHFGSLAWEAEALPPGWPRALDASTWQATVGWQFRLREDAEAAPAAAPPACCCPCGTD
jgi:hypothetical protein